MIQTRFMRFVFLILIGLIMAVPLAHADKHKDLKKQELQQIESDLKAQKTQQENLRKQQSDVAKKLQSVRGQLIDLTGDIQDHENALLKVQNRQEETQKEYDESKRKLDNQRGALAQLIVGLQRLGRLPPQALLARPSTPIDTARSFSLLQHVIPTVSAQAKDIKIILDDMNELRAKLDMQELDLREQQKTLAVKRDSLEKIVSERQALLKKTESSQTAALRKANALAAQAKDIRTLLATLETQEKEDPALRMKPLAKLRSGLGSAFKSLLGSAKLPVTGQIKTGFGEIIGGGGKSQGLSIAAASGAIVTAPHDGVIRFAGPFRQYKLLVIIQHSNGEHSLLGGLQELYTKTGEHVAAGEPIGKLPSVKMEGDSSQQASLYYERRRNGKPIDPRSARG